MASWLQKISSGNESRARKEKVLQRVFQTGIRVFQDRDELHLVYLMKNFTIKEATAKIATFFTSSYTCEDGYFLNI